MQMGCLGEVLIFIFQIVVVGGQLCIRHPTRKWSCDFEKHAPQGPFEFTSQCVCVGGENRELNRKSNHDRGIMGVFVEC